MIDLNSLMILLLGIIIGVITCFVLLKLPLFATTRHILNKAQIKAIGHSNTDGFVIIDHSGQIIHVNQAILAIFGYEQQELLTQSISILMQDKDAKQHNQYINTFLETGITKFIGTERQVTACKKGGIRINISLSINEVIVSKKTYFVAFIRDITDEVQMYRQIEYQRNKFETLFNYSPDGIVYVNEKSQVLDANDSFLALFDDELDNILHQNVRNLYQADTPELNHIKKLLQDMGEDWGQSEMLARLNSRLKRRVTVIVTRQSVVEHDSTMVIYVFRDISKELDLIAHIAEKNRSQELSEAMVKMGYWRFDVKKGQLWCSNQVFQMLKLPSQANNIVDIDTLYKLIDPSGQQTVIDAIQGSFDHLMPLSLSIPIKTVKGELRHIVLKGICEASLGELTSIYGVFQDISEQLAQEESLRLTKERLEQSQAFSNIGNWQWDIQSGNVFWSELTSPMFGEKQQSLTREYEQFISQVHPGDKNALLAAISRCTEQAEKFDIEFRVIWPDESIHWLHQQGDVIRDADSIATSMIGVVQNITERKDKETELQLFKQIIESSDQGIMVADHLGYLIYANPAHQHKFRHAADVSQYHFSDFLSLDFDSSVQNLDIEQSLAQKGNWAGEIQSRRTDNTTFPAHVSLGQFEDPSNNFKYRFSISYDISEDIAQNQKIKQAKLDAESANRAKSEFLSSMSHELRTPLNAVLGFSQLLLRQKEVEFTNRITGNIEAIFKAGEHLLTLINGILDLAKIESGNRPPECKAVNIKEVIDEAIHLITPQAQERGLSLQTPEGGKIPVLFSQRKVPVVDGDFTMIKQALLNYLSNAIKYNKENGIIFVTVDVDDITQTTRITVSDNGIGIAADSICELFIPFNRLGLENSNIQGTGIGLAITKKNIENLNGSVGAQSKLGAGSSFWIELPYIKLIALNQSTPTAPSAPLLSSLKPAAINLTVLYIEDNLSNIELMQGYFEDITTARLICAENAELGIIYAAEYQPNVVLMDLNLPGMDGYSALKQLKADAQFNHTVMIAVTADVMNKTKDKVKESGFDEFLSKPISFDTLQTMLNKYQLSATD